MKKYIERQALKADLQESYEGLKNIYKVLKHDEERRIAEAQFAVITEAILRVKDAPAADVVEVRHAKWVSLTPPLLLEEFRAMEADKFFMCSECKGECQLVEQDDYYDYCPRCGCKMDKEE